MDGKTRRDLDWIQSRSEILAKLKKKAGEECKSWAELERGVTLELRKSMREGKCSLTLVELFLFDLRSYALFTRERKKIGERHLRIGDMCWKIRFVLSVDDHLYVSVLTPSGTTLRTTTALCGDACDCPGHRHWRVLLLLSALDQLGAWRTKGPFFRLSPHLKASLDQPVAMAAHSLLAARSARAEVAPVKSLSEIALRTLAKMPSCSLPTCTH